MQIQLLFGKLSYLAAFAVVTVDFFIYAGFVQTGFIFTLCFSQAQ
jgi:hypothetical protein